MTPTAKQTVAELADEILFNLPQAEIDYLRRLPESDLCLLHHGWGTSIRNECGLWDPDHPLTTHWHKFPEERDMRDGTDYSADHPDSVSMDIMKDVYKKVKVK